jgi:hypothetical protein
LSADSPLAVRTYPHARARVAGLRACPVRPGDWSSTWEPRESGSPEIAANFNAPSATVAPSLGRPLSGNAANVTVNLVEPGTMYGERANQLDLQFGKTLRFGGTRAVLSVDLYNALNADAVITQNNSNAAWQRPQAILQARFAKFGVQVDF